MTKEMKWRHKLIFNLDYTAVSSGLLLCRVHYLRLRQMTYDIYQ